MPAIGSVSAIADKWARVTPQRVKDYELGVKNPKKNWQENTEAAKDAWEQGITEAASDDRFAKGVAAAGTAKWQRKASTVGTQRFGPGVQAAKSDYEQGFAPFAEVIRSTSLPPRGSKGDPRNYEISKVMGEALHDAKVSR